MKRMLAILLLACLLLSTGCCCIVDEKKPALNVDVTEGDLETEPDAVVSTQAPEAPETEAQETAVAEPQPELVTVYLVDKIDMYDNGSITYEYDEYGNLKFNYMWDIDGTLLYTTHFEEPDANGMPCKILTDWVDYETYSKTLEYFADGKINSEMSDGAIYTGYQYEYDLKGDMTQKRQYIDGILEQTVCCEYDGEELAKVYAEDPDGNLIYYTTLENGRIVEKFFPNPDYPSRNLYKYDENGNLLSQTYEADGASRVIATYSYKTIQVDYDRAQYLLKQQNYVLSVI